MSFSLELNEYPSEPWKELVINSPLRGSAKTVLQVIDGKEVNGLIKLEDININRIRVAKIEDHALKMELKSWKVVSFDIAEVLWVCNTKWLLMSLNWVRKKKDRVLSHTRPFMSNKDLEILPQQLIWIKPLTITQWFQADFTNQLIRPNDWVSTVVDKARIITKSLTNALETDVVFLEDAKTKSPRYREVLASVLHWAAQFEDIEKQKQILWIFYIFEEEDYLESHLHGIQSIRKMKASLGRCLQIVNGL